MQLEEFSVYLQSQNQGALAERLGTGLQNLGQRFDSARHLPKKGNRKRLPFLRPELPLFARGLQKVPGPRAGNRPLAALEATFGARGPTQKRRPRAEDKPLTALGATFGARGPAQKLRPRAEDKPLTALEATFGARDPAQKRRPRAKRQQLPGGYSTYRRRPFRYSPSGW